MWHKSGEDKDRQRRKAKTTFLWNQTGFSSSHSFSYRCNSGMLSRVPDLCAKRSQQDHLCATEHKGSIHVCLPGVLLGEDDEQGFGQLFLHHFRNQRVVMVDILPLRILLIASFIDLRQFSHWHRRKNGKNQCWTLTAILLSARFLLTSVLFLCEYQPDCHWLCLGCHYQPFWQFTLVSSGAFTWTLPFKIHSDNF